MAIKIKTKGQSSVSMAAVLKTLQKDLGDGIGNFGGTKSNTDRCPTGIYELDVALGGGFPRGKCSMIYGMESSNKTNIALLMIAQHQRNYPKEVCAFIDIEHSFDPDWAKRLGVDVDKLIVIHPEYAEQAVNVVETLLFAEDCGIVVMDSIAALVTAAELDSDAEKEQVGGSAKTIAKLVRRTTHALSEAEKEGRRPTLIYINQITYKIGVMFGDPETTPGGPKPRHQAAIILRVYGKNVNDKKISEAMPVAKEVNFIVKKWKCPILRSSGKFEMVTIAHKGLKPGQSDDFNLVKADLESFGLWVKNDKKGYTGLGEQFDTIQAFKDKLYGDPEYGAEIRENLILKMLASSGLIEGGEA